MIAKKKNVNHRNTVPNTRTACMTRIPTELSGAKHEMKKQPLAN